MPVAKKERTDHKCLWQRKKDEEWPLTTQPTGCPSHRLREECPFSGRVATDRAFWLEDSVRRRNGDSSGMFLCHKKWILFPVISKTSTDFIHFHRTLHGQWQLSCPWWHVYTVRHVRQQYVKVSWSCVVREAQGEQLGLWFYHELIECVYDKLCKRIGSTLGQWYSDQDFERYNL